MKPKNFPGRKLERQMQAKKEFLDDNTWKLARAIRSKKKRD